MKYLVIYYNMRDSLEMKVFDDFAHAATFRVELGDDAKGSIIEAIEYKDELPANPIQDTNQGEYYGG